MMRNAMLAEVRATARDREQRIKDHRQNYCPACRPRKACTELAGYQADLAAAREAIRTWFAPGPGQDTLI